MPYASSFLLLFSISCSFSPETRSSSEKIFPLGLNYKEVEVYFTKSKGQKSNISFIPVKRKVSKDDSIIDSSLKELFLGPTKQEEFKGIMTEIPVGARLIRVEESEDEVLIDVSPQYLTGAGSATMQLRYLQLFKTLKKIAPNKKLYLHVDGKSIKTIGQEGLEVTQPLSKINDYTKVNEKSHKVEP